MREAFGRIARRYVLTNHVLSFGIDLIWRKVVARRVAGFAPGLVLDVATGSGDLAAAVQRACPDARVVGADFSIPMLTQARRLGLENLILADAMNLPLADGAVDAVTVGFGLRNMASWPDAIREMARVLRPGGSLCVLDFSLPAWAPLRVVHRFYLRQVMPWVAGMLTGERSAYEYLCTSIEAFPSGETMCGLLRSHGFFGTEFRPLSGGIASLYVATKAV
ncbi:MAG TPA: ubiquinone/menaquinone biosynthesis methyltransferase [Verrucomicrobiaceae bacterium]